MASKAEKKPEAAAPAPEAPKKKLPFKAIIAAVTVVGMEAGTIAMTAKLTGGPQVAAAAPLVTPQPVRKQRFVEVAIDHAKLPNSRSGQLYLYDISVVATVRAKEKQKVKRLLRDRLAEVQDHIRAIIASADPKTLAQPGLQTLRRQLRYQLRRDLGKHLVRQLLIPQCTPFRAEF